MRGVSSSSQLSVPNKARIPGQCLGNENCHFSQNPGEVGPVEIRAKNLAAPSITVIIPWLAELAAAGKIARAAKV